MRSTSPRPQIAEAVSELPRDPRSNQGWSSEPLAGNYNECAQLSVVIVKANTNAENPNTRAVMFHRGEFIPSGVPDTYGFNGIDNSVSTGDTVALRYSDGVSGLNSIVKFRWNGNGVELDRKHARLTGSAEMEFRAARRATSRPGIPFRREVVSAGGPTVGHVFVADDRVIYSASDLAAASRCEYALLRAFDARLGRGSAVAVEDELLARTAKLGGEHEQRHLDRLRDLVRRCDHRSAARTRSRA